MKRNSKEGKSDRQAGIHKDSWDGSPAGPLEASSFSDLEGWSREDFEAALPLYVGGELDALEAARVDAWLIAHPEDQESLAASKQAAGVLARYAEFTMERETPDLWAGIRSGLLESGALEAASTAGSIAGSTEGSAGPKGRSLSKHERPILGGPRWFQRKSVAAAAALLLTGSVGLFLMSRGAALSGGEVASPSGAAAVAASGGGKVVASPAFVATASGSAVSLPGQGLLGGVAGTLDSPLQTTPVGNAPDRIAPRGDISRGKSRKLQLAQKGDERLIDDAPKALLWQYDPWAETNQGQRRNKAARSNGPQLVGGR